MFEDYINRLRQWQYFDDAAFIVGILLILWAWKWGIEGIVAEAIE